MYLPYFSREKLFFFLIKNFFQAQFNTPKQIKEVIIIMRAICPPDLSETQTAHIKLKVSVFGIKIFANII